MCANGRHEDSTICLWTRRASVMFWWIAKTSGTQGDMERERERAGRERVSHVTKGSWGWLQTGSNDCTDRREATERQPNFMASSLLTLPASPSIYNPARNSSGRFWLGDLDCVFPSSALGSRSSSSSSSRTTRSLLQKHWGGGGGCGAAHGCHNGFSGIGISYFLQGTIFPCVCFLYPACWMHHLERL